MRRLVVPAAVLAVVAGIASPTAAHAAPGDTTAVGAALALNVQLGTIIDEAMAATTPVASATVPGSATQVSAATTLVDLPWARVDVDSAAAAVDSTASAAKAEAAATGVAVSLFGVDVASFATVDASAACAPNQFGETSTSTTGEVILGEPGPFPAGESYQTRVTLGSNVQVGPQPGDTADLSGLTLIVDYYHSNLGGRSAQGTGAVLVFALDGTYEGQTFAGQRIGSLALADALCTSLTAPFTVTGVTPASGPVGAERTVTITGSGFLPRSSVTFDGVAVDFVIDATGTSITAVLPARATAGTGTLTVDDFEFNQLEVTYEYLAAAAAPAAATPAAPVRLLAESGADTGAWMPLATMLLGAGAITMIVARRRRRV